jgi:hypothetical protein
MSVQVISGDGIAEKGTAIVTISPVDDNGTALTFAQITSPEWQLMNIDGTVINDRTFANSAMTSLQFVLSGDDLAIFGDSDRGNRVLSFSAQYTGTLDDSTSFTGNIVAEGVFNVFRVLGQVDA